MQRNGGKIQSNHWEEAILLWFDSLRDCELY